MSHVHVEVGRNIKNVVVNLKYKYKYKDNEYVTPLVTHIGWILGDV